MNTISGLWGWVPLIGGVVLGAALIFALWGNSKRASRRDVDRSEAGAAQLQQQLDREDKTR